VLKALGDNTRYAIYLEVARAPTPRSTAEIAETLGLHPNTVRPHLERMREVGLLEVAVDSRGQVGRPQHRYLLAPDAPSLGLEPPAFPLLARMLTTAAALAGADPHDAVLAGREEGQARAHEVLSRSSSSSEPALTPTSSVSCLDFLVDELARLGFDPVVVSDAEDPAGPADSHCGHTTTVAFTHCPYRELAEAYPELVCHLHRGLVEGFVEEIGTVGVDSFGTLADRQPCQVTIVESDKLVP
jgi:predicted ArsR family transcriptional regulator